MDFEGFVELIEGKISPFSLNEAGKSSVANLVRKYPADLLIECVDIGVEQYLLYDSEGNPTKASVQKFLNKLGGIAYNKSLDPIRQEIQHIKAVAKSIYPYWNDSCGSELLEDYVCALQAAGWAKDAIVRDLQSDVIRLTTNRCRNWTQWSDSMREWISDIENWKNDNAEQIAQDGTIIPDAITNNLPKYIQKLIWQVNASYENHLFDCCAIIMRRLLEVLLILSYQNNGIEMDIMDAGGDRHKSLDKIIKDAAQNKILALSANTRKDMVLFKDLGNYSAHKIWFNCTQKDISLHALKYRAIIEELIYKANIRR